MITENYVGCDVFIQDKGGNTLARTRVLEQNWDYMIISVVGSIPATELGEFVTVLILTKDSIHEYQGKVRRSVTNSTASDIALFKGKIKENRLARRYIVNAKAQIPCLVIDVSPTPLLHPLEIFIVNLSSSGALLRAKPNSFVIGAIIEIRVSISGVETTIYGTIVRVREVDEMNCEYGCKFVSVE